MHFPTGDEYRNMTEEEQEAVYEEAAALSDAYFSLSEEEQAMLDISRMEELFGVINEDIALLTATGPVTFLNSGYPYGKNMTRSSVTLVIEVEETNVSYQWQVATSKNGTYSDISGATADTYTFSPTSGYWYRCMVNETASEAVMTVYPGQDGRTWTKPYSSWYISNGSMAYVANGTYFDVVGLYNKNGTDYMLCTSYGTIWDLFSSTSASPSAGTTTSASLDAFRISFDASDAFNVFLEADLASGHQAFAFGCDTMLGNSSTSGNYSDRAALNAMVKNGVLQQIAMIGAASVESAADEDPAFVIAPVTPVSKFWIGSFRARKTYAYNTSGGMASEMMNGENVVTLVENTDSGMTMSWMNVPSGGLVKFRFSVGSVADTGAVSGKINYENESLTGLEPNTKYIITVGDEQFPITSDENGEIPLTGDDDNGNPYDFLGKTITVAKDGSQDTPAEIEVADRPVTPDNPSDLEEGEEGDDVPSTPTIDSNIEIVELTTTSVTISPREGQQYAYYSTDGTNWITLTNRDGNGNYVIDGLEEGSTIQIRTRIAATDTAPASQWSAATTVKLKSTAVASVTGWRGNYDGKPHSISVNVTSPEEGATVTYSSGANSGYSETIPGLITAGEHTLYYRVNADGYYPAYGSANVIIDKKEISVESVELNNDNSLKRVEFTDLVSGDELLLDTDYFVSNWNVSMSATGMTASFNITLKNTEKANNYQLMNTYMSGVSCHTHSWIYKVDDSSRNMIKAYCVETEQSDCCPYYGEENAVKLTLKASNAVFSESVYDESANVALVDTNETPVTDGRFPVTKDTLGNVVYYLEDGTTLTTTNNSGAEEVGGAPKNVGTYWANVTVTDKNDNTYVATQQFKIQKAVQEAVVTMDDYTFGETVSQPSLENKKEMPDVTFYYNTVNSNENGTKWENIAPETLDKGNYYMYAVLSATDNYNAYTTPTTEFEVIGKNMTEVKADPVEVTYNKAGHGINVTGYPAGAVITYGTEDGVYNLADSPEFKDVSAAPNHVYYKVTAKGYHPFYGETTVTILPKEVALIWSDTELVYNGSVQKPVAALTTDSLCEGDTCDVMVIGGEKNYSASAYTATATAVSNPNYKLPEEIAERQTSFTIAKKEIGVSWSDTEFNYDGTAHKPVAEPVGVVQGDICSVTVSGEKVNAGRSYVATASVDNENYRIKSSQATTTFIIQPKPIIENMISLDSIDNSYTITGSEVSPQVTVRDNLGILEMGEDKDYILTGEISEIAYGTYEIVVTGKGNYTGTVTVTWSITDPNAPAGTISIKTNRWNTFLNTITFGHFFKETQNVTVTAADGENESGVDKLYYYVAQTPFTNMTDLNGVTWKEISNGGSFNINPNAKIYVYVKITDKAGNAAYISTDGIVVYTDSVQATKNITFYKTSNENVTADVVLNGNTIAKITNGTAQLVKGTDYTISEDGKTITFMASYLQGLAAGEYTLCISYHPGGETYVDVAGNDKPLDTEVTLTVKKSNGWVSDISDISKIYDGLAVAEPTFTTSNNRGAGQSNVTIEYKEKNADDSTYTTVKPVNAGEYVVRVTVKADENYETASNTATFIIGKADISVTAQNYEGVYDGKAHGITVNVTQPASGYTVFYGTKKDGEIIYKQSPVTYQNVGTYQVYYKVVSDNYITKTGLENVTISPKVIGVEWTNVTFTYDGTPHVPTAVATGLVAGDTCRITVAGEQTQAGHDYVATATALSNDNYKLPENVTISFAIRAANLTITVKDAKKHIGKLDPAFTYSITEGTLIEGDRISGITLYREVGETAGNYLISATEIPGSNPNYNISFTEGTFTIEDHISVTDEAVEPTCTETGLAEGSHCSVCDEVLVEQEVVPSLGHDWSDWEQVSETRQQSACNRCEAVRYQAVNPDEDPTDAGSLETSAEVAQGALVDAVVMNNSRQEILNAPGIFTPEEREAIENGSDARVWLEISQTDPNSIPEGERQSIESLAAQIMGDAPSITYFDADLFKQIADGERTRLHEPGIMIRITIQLPNELINRDSAIRREYKLIRLHTDQTTGESRVDVLDGSFNEATGEFTFETDKFSTYAIVY